MTARLRLAHALLAFLCGCSQSGPGLLDALADRSPSADHRALDSNGGRDGPRPDAGLADRPRADGQSCAPLPPVATLALFTQLQADLATLQGAAARQARVDAFLAAVAASGTYPVRDATSVVFLYRGAATGGVAVAGTFNSWSATADALQAFSDTDLYYAIRPLGGSRHEYKVVASGAWLTDPLSPHVVWDGIARAGLGELNSVVPAWGAPDPKGRIERRRVGSPQLANERDVLVYLPPAYDDDRCATYPLLLVNDGNESLTRSHFDVVAAATFGAKKARPAILAFVALASQNDRMSEYSCEASSSGPKYTDFLCDTLAPLLDKSYRTQGGAASRGIIGASMGGLISYAALFWRNDCLRRAGSQSGSFFYADNELIKRVQAAAAGSVQLTAAYLDNGTDNRDCTIAMRDALKARGYSVVHQEDLAQDHTWEAWADRFDEALAALYPP